MFQPGAVSSCRSTSAFGHGGKSQLYQVLKDKCPAMNIGEASSGDWGTVRCEDRCRIQICDKEGQLGSVTGRKTHIAPTLLCLWFSAIRCPS